MLPKLGKKISPKNRKENCPVKKKKNTAKKSLRKSEKITLKNRAFYPQVNAINFRSKETNTKRKFYSV